MLLLVFVLLFLLRPPPPLRILLSPLERETSVTLEDEDAPVTPELRDSTLAALGRNVLESEPSSGLIVLAWSLSLSCRSWRK